MYGLPETDFTSVNSVTVANMRADVYLLDAKALQFVRCIAHFTKCRVAR